MSITNNEAVFAEMAATIERLKAAQHVPGMRQCPACGFNEEGAFNEEGEEDGGPGRCPNGCGPLQAVTLEEHARDLRESREWALSRLLAVAGQVSTLTKGWTFHPEETGALPAPAHWQHNTDEHRIDVRDATLDRLAELLKRDAPTEDGDES